MDVLRKDTCEGANAKESADLSLPVDDHTSPDRIWTGYCSRDADLFTNPMKSS